MVKFYDTNALLLKMESLFEEHFAISSVSLSELEKIKTSAGKDQNIKYSFVDFVKYGVLVTPLVLLSAFLVLFL